MYLYMYILISICHEMDLLIKISSDFEISMISLAEQEREVSVQAHITRKINVQREVFK